MLHYVKIWISYCYEHWLFKTVLFYLYNAVNGGHMFNATVYILLLPRKVILFSLVAHKDSVSISTATNYAY